MEAEIKKQIIQGLIRNNVLVGEDILSKLDSITDINLLNRIKNDNMLILKDNLNEIKENNEINSINENIKKEEEISSVDKIIKFEDLDFSDEEIENKKIKRKVKIIKNYDKFPEKKKYADFVSIFNHRYKALMRMLVQRQELQGIQSISRLKNKEERETVAVIGLISEVSETNNGHFLITLEDDTGTIKALISKNSQKKELLSVAKDLVLDEVIGITGVMGDNIIFINNIIFPDIPLSKEFKKAKEEEYAVFMGDIHFGSKYFLHKEFSKFKKWLKGEIGNDSQKELTKKIKYLFITGDMVEGVGIYPGQQNDLDVKDIFDQYQLFIDFVNEIPNEISIIVCPGNHDALRIAEPQPPISKKYLKELYDKDNVFLVSSPSMVNIAATENFSGFDVLLYHGYSFTYFSDKVPSIREKGGQERVDLIMKFLLQKRHLAPTHTSNLYIPDNKEDPLVIKQIPDFFISGHIHRATYATYRNISLINTSTWVGITDFQEKLGLKPQPAKIILSNLQTREMRMLNFEEKKNEENNLSKKIQDNNQNNKEN